MRRAGWSGVVAVRSILFLLACLFWATAASPQSGTLVDVTTQVAVSRSGLVFNGATQTFDTVVTVTNVSPSSLTAPLVLVVIPFRYQYYLVWVIMEADLRSVDVRTYERHTFRAPLEHRRA